MNEHHRQHIAYKFNQMRYGMVHVVYDDNLLDLEIQRLGLTTEGLGYVHYVLLAEHTFNALPTSHMKEATFSIELHGEDRTMALGKVRFDTGGIESRCATRDTGAILSDLSQYLKYQPAFKHCTVGMTDDNLLTVTDEEHMIIFTSEIDHNQPTLSTITTQTIFESAHPTSDQVIQASAPWAHVCDYAIRLGHDKHKTLPRQSSTTITIGALAEPPSEIEHALALELTRVREKLGAAAILPNLEDALIPSNQIEQMLINNKVTPSELTVAARQIVAQKILQCGTSGKMENITEFCIETTVDAIVSRRTDNQP